MSLHRIRERQVFWHQAQLDEHRELVPRNVLVVQSIAPDIDDCSKRDAQLLACGRYAGNAIRSRGQAS